MIICFIFDKPSRFDLLFLYITLIFKVLIHYFRHVTLVIGQWEMTTNFPTIVPLPFHYFTTSNINSNLKQLFDTSKGSWIWVCQNVYI